jgi:hypothetical protein
MMPPTSLMLSLVAVFISLSWFSLVLLEHAPWAGLVATYDGLGLTLSTVSPVSVALRRRRGRPRKFDGPSRAVTLTLPETVIASLSAVDPDLSRAVVSLAKRGRQVNGVPPATLAVFGNRAVITVRPTKSLERRIGVNLVPLSDGRALISFHQPKSIAELELLIYDALEDKSLSAEDRRVFEGIGTILRDARRSSDVSLLHRSIIVLESSQRILKPAPTRP